jgi:hypothetical protein
VDLGPQGVGGSAEQHAALAEGDDVEIFHLGSYLSSRAPRDQCRTLTVPEHDTGAIRVPPELFAARGATFSQG